MRLKTTLLAATALALLAGAPATQAQGDHHEPPPPANSTEQAQRLLRAADGFDRRAASMRARSGRLNDSALTLRQEAEDLFAGSTGDADPADGKQHPSDEQPTEGTPEEETPADPCGSSDDELEDFGRGDHSGDGEGEGEGDQDVADVEEACRLLETAERLERRAAALTVAADRMQQHACKLREKAAKLLAGAGQTDSERLLAKAAKLRAHAAKLRATADYLRDNWSEGTEVDEEVVNRVERLETRAAQLDKAADRLEARAAAASKS